MCISLIRSVLLRSNWSYLIAAYIACTSRARACQARQGRGQRNLRCSLDAVHLGLDLLVPAYLILSCGHSKVCGKRVSISSPHFHSLRLSALPSRQTTLEIITCFWYCPGRAARKSRTNYYGIRQKQCIQPRRNRGPSTGNCSMPKHLYN